MTTETAEDELVNVYADLLAQFRYQQFVLRLVAGPAGRWQPLAELVVDFNHLRETIRSLEESLSTPTHVTWLEYPDFSGGLGYITVMFFNERGMNRIWIYKRP